MVSYKRACNNNIYFFKVGSYIVYEKLIKTNYLQYFTYFKEEYLIHVFSEAEITLCSGTRAPPPKYENIGKPDTLCLSLNPLLSRHRALFLCG